MTTLDWENTPDNLEGYTEEEFKFLVQLNKKLQGGKFTPGVYVRITEEEIKRICELVTRKLQDEPTLVEVQCPVVIFGDVHGQFIDLWRFFRESEYPSSRKFLFLGDYVDRGPQSVELITLLFTYKALFPRNIVLLRGNHEDPKIYCRYGFMDELERRYGDKKVHENFANAFNYLPLAAIIDNVIFCTHGGIARQLMASPTNNIREIFSRIIRPVQIPIKGLIYELLWNDPAFNRSRPNGRPVDQTKQPAGWATGDRNGNFKFGKKITNRFMAKFGLKYLFRGHQFVLQGLEIAHDRQVYTIFSAPGYGKANNIAVVMVLTNADNPIESEVIIRKPMRPPVTFEPLEPVRDQDSDDPV